MTDRPAHCIIFFSFFFRFLGVVHAIVRFFRLFFFPPSPTCVAGRDSSGLIPTTMTVCCGRRSLPKRKVVPLILDTDEGTVISLARSVIFLHSFSFPKDIKCPRETKRGIITKCFAYIFLRPCCFALSSSVFAY